VSSLPKMLFPYDSFALLIRICGLGLYLYLFPALLKEIAYILSLFMPSLLLQISHLSGYYLFLATTICVLDVQDKVINSVTLSRALQVYRLRKKERGIIEYINNYIDKSKVSNIPITPFCLCQTSGSKVNNNSGWCESCGLGLVPGVMLPPWTSGHPEINRIIFRTQIESNHIFDHIEWINYDRFTNVKKICKGSRGDVFSASWIDGSMYLYGMARNGEQNVIIKSLGKSSVNVTPEFLRSIQCYGLTRNPNTQEYMLVTDYIKGGDLRNYLSKNFKNMKWLDDKLKILISITKGLKLIHELGFVHHDLHLGNVLIGDDGSAFISDLGLYPFITLSDQGSKNSSNETTLKGEFKKLDEMIKSDVEEKPTIFESEDVVYYSQFIDLDAISKEETFEVLDDDDLYSAKPYNIEIPSDVSTN
ncbi:1573_t:CDS:2, partial [Dentiscutata erythropus]